MEANTANIKDKPRRATPPVLRPVGGTGILVLTREEGEGIVIGDPIIARVTVERIGGNRVRIGIEAAPHIPIHRDEIRVEQKAGGSS